MKYREWPEWGRRTLGEAGIPERDAELDARLLLEDAARMKLSELSLEAEKDMEERFVVRYREQIRRRAERIPLQHLTGIQNFMGLDFQVDRRVLVPRQDTETLVEEVLRELQDGMRVLDLCTGSGCILISLLRYTNGCRGVGVDLSEDALTVARENAERLLGDQADRVVFLKSDLFERVTGTFEFIVSNPPYIPSAAIPELMPEVREHEPRMALDGGEDGLCFYRRITEESRAYLTGGGMLYFEIGYDQAEPVKALMESAGFAEVTVVKDLAGLDRVVYGTYIRK